MGKLSVLGNKTRVKFSSFMLLLLAKNVQKLHNYDYHLRRSKVVGVKGPTGEPVAHGGALVKGPTGEPVTHGAALVKGPTGEPVTHGGALVKGPTGEPVAHGGALVRAACLVYAWLCLTSCWAFTLIVAPARYQGI